MRYHLTCFDKGNCEYAEIEVEANDWTHALQRLAAQLPNEPAAYVLISERAEEQGCVNE